MTMIWERLQSAGAIVLFALAYFFDRSGIFVALIPAVIVHEFGHVAALWCCGAHIKGVHVSLTGLRLDYSGSLMKKERVIAILAGPLAGALLSLALMNIQAPFWRLCGTLSAALTMFNLLPALPLDGGRLLLLFGGKNVARRCSVIVGWCMVLMGAIFATRMGTLSLLCMGLWLLLYQGIVR